MALNMDDLIGSMQHGFHAGDRGNDLNEIRESLKHSLPPQQLQNQAQQQNAQAGPSYPRRAPPGASSLDADVAMLSSSAASNQWSTQQYGNGGGAFFGGPGSWGSQNSASSGLGGPAGAGWGFAPAPANTPQQTPVETSALARQLQAELERQASPGSFSPPQNHTTGGYTTQPLSPALSAHSASGGGGGGIHAVSPPPQLGMHTLHPAPGGARSNQTKADSPRSYVNGFAPQREDSATPTGTGRGTSLSPQLGPGGGAMHGQ